MNPLNQYRRTRIMTASPGELLVMLYDGLLQRVRRARLSFEKSDWATAGEALGRCQDILHELMASLDPEKSPELADSLIGLYSYCSARLLKAVAERDTAPLDEVYELMKPMRDAWAEANRTLRESPAAKVVNG